MIALLLLALQAATAPPPPATGEDIVVTGKQPNACGPRYAALYVAPMGEPTRGNGIHDPMKHWFDQADADHDGRLTPDEMQADAQRFFSTIDTDHDDELDPQEVSAYEIDVAPEIRLYKFGSFAKPKSGREKREARRDARQRADYQAVVGAGEWASLNIPEPVASTDLDIDRGITRAEYARVVAKRFALLDTARLGYLGYAALPRSPAQEAIDACYAKLGNKAR